MPGLIPDGRGSGLALRSSASADGRRFPSRKRPQTTAARSPWRSSWAEYGGMPPRLLTARVRARPVTASLEGSSCEFPCISRRRSQRICTRPRPTRPHGQPQAPASPFAFPLGVSPASPAGDDARLHTPRRPGLDPGPRRAFGLTRGQGHGAAMPRGGPAVVLRGNLAWAPDQVRGDVNGEISG